MLHRLIIVVLITNISFNCRSQSEKESILDDVLTWDLSEAGKEKNFNPNEPLFGRLLQEDAFSQHFFQAPFFKNLALGGTREAAAKNLGSREPAWTEVHLIDYYTTTPQVILTYTDDSDGENFEVSALGYLKVGSEKRSSIDTPTDSIYDWIEEVYFEFNQAIDKTYFKAMLFKKRKEVSCSFDDDILIFPASTFHNIDELVETNEAVYFGYDTGARIYLYASVIEKRENSYYIPDIGVDFSLY